MHFPDIAEMPCCQHQTDIKGLPLNLNNMQIIALLNHQFLYDIEYESCDIRGDTSKECLGSNHKTTKIYMKREEKQKILFWRKKMCLN